MKRINLMNAVEGLEVRLGDIVKLALLSEPQAHFSKTCTVSESIETLENHKEYCINFIELTWSDIQKREKMSKEEKEKADDNWECLHFTGVKNILHEKYVRDKNKVDEKKAREIYEHLKSRHDGYIKSNNKKGFLDFFYNVMYKEFLYFYSVDKDLFTVNALKNGDVPIHDSVRFFTKEYIENVRNKMEQVAYSLEDKIKIEVQRAWYIGLTTAQEQIDALKGHNIPVEVIAKLVYVKGKKGFGHGTIGAILEPFDGKDEDHFKRKAKQLLARAEKQFNIISSP